MRCCLQSKTCIRVFFRPALWSIKNEQKKLSENISEKALLIQKLATQLEELKKQLEDRGYEVYMTRDNKESDLSESERAKNVNASGAQILISLHANGGEDSTEKGVEVMAPSYENPYWKDRTGNIKKSNALADIILQSYCEETGLNAKGLYNVDNQILLNWSEIPSVVLEMGFMSNESDDAYMAEEEHQQEMAEGIADGIDLYFGRS